MAETEAQARVRLAKDLFVVEILSKLNDGKRKFYRFYTELYMCSKSYN